MQQKRDERQGALKVHIEMFPIRLLGFGLYLAWGAVVSSFEQANGVAELSSPLARLGIGTALTSAGLLAVAWYAHDLRTGSTQHTWQRFVAPACAACALFSSVADLASVALGSLVLDMVSVTLKSAAGIGLFIAWNVQLAAFGPRTAWVAYAGSSTLAPAIYLAVVALGPTIVTIMTLVLPIASASCLAASMRLPQPDRTPEEPISWQFPWKPLLLAATFALVRGFVGHYGGNVLVADELGRLLAGLVVLAGLLWTFDRFNVELVARLSPALIVASLALCGIHGVQGTTEAAKMLGCLGYYALTLYLCLRLNALSYRFGMSAAWLFGTVQAAITLFSLVGSILGNQMRALGEIGSFAIVDGVTGLLATVVTLLCMFAIAGHNADDAWGIRGVRTSADMDDSGEPLSAGSDYLHDHIRACADVARHFGLTHREEEVLALLAEGKSFQEVEGALTIAHGTMRVHVQHIYAKLDVHSCEEACNVVRTWKARG